jgi:hypothetical protein
MLLVDPKNRPLSPIDRLNPTIALFDLSFGTDFFSLQMSPGRVSHPFDYQRPFNCFRSSSRPREIRDFTVPIPIPSAAAVSS